MLGILHTSAALRGDAVARPMVVWDARAVTRTDTATTRVFVRGVMKSAVPQ